MSSRHITLLALLASLLLWQPQRSAFAREKGADRVFDQELKQFLSLRNREDRLRAREFFDKHPALLRSPIACAEEALNLSFIRRNDNVVFLAKRSVELEPGTAATFRIGALALSFAHHCDLSLKFANQAVALKPDAQTLSALAEVLQAAKQFPQMQKALDEARRKDSGCFEVAAASCRTARALFKKQEALTPLDFYLVKHPKSIPALLLRAETHMINGNSQLAIDDYTNVLLQDGGHSEALRARAEIYRKEQVWNLAVVDLRRLLTDTICDDDRLLAYVRLADCLERTGDLRAALSARNEVVAISTRGWDDKTFNGRISGSVARDMVKCAILQNRLKQFGPALKNTTIALRSRPMDSEAQEQHAIALEGLSRYPEAIKAWSVLIEKHPRYPKWLKQRSRLYAKTGQAQLAISDRERAAKLDSDSGFGPDR